MYHATGIGGSLTGLGFNVGIIDDPVKDREQADSEVERENAWDWFSSTFYTRSLKGSGMLIIQTPWHWDEIAQRLLEIQDVEGAEKWQVIELPALARDGDALGREPGQALCEELIPREQLLRMRATMDARDWSALYQCRPVPEEGDFFKAKDLQTYTKLPSCPLYWYISCDPAISEKDGRAYTVAVLCAVDPDKNVYVHDMFRERTGSKDIVEGIFNLAESAPRRVETIIIEAGHIQKTMKPMLELEAEKRHAYIPMQFPNPISDKETRARPLQYLIENHRVHFKEGKDYAEYIRPELLSFPAGKFKDIVDSLSWLAYLLQINACPAPAKNPGPTPDREINGTYANLETRTPKALADRLRDRHAPKPLFGGANRKRNWGGR
jgi:predicted phage terminase large subunit-like protein